MKKLIFAAICLALLFGCSNGRTKAELGNYKNAAGSDAFRNGWIPSDFPNNTFNIIVEHDMEMNKTWIECSYSGELVFGARDLKPGEDSAAREEFEAYFGADKRALPMYSLGKNEFVLIEKAQNKMYYYCRK